MIVSAAQRHLERVLPWAALGDGFFVVCFVTGDNKFNTRSFRTIDGMTRFIQTIQERTDVLHVYFGLASQRVAGRRSAANALLLKAIWIDIDCKEGAYGGTNEIIMALAAFCRASKMPQPTMVVETGSGGLHVYWCFNRALAVVEWQLLANALSEACRHQGLIIDHGVTVDRARVLRVAGTFNRKPQYVEPRRAVLGAHLAPLDHSPEVMAIALAKYMQVKSAVVLGKTAVRGKFSAVWADGSKIDISRHPHLAGVPISDNMGAGIGLPPPTREAVALRCPWLANTLKTGGRGQAYSEWRAALRLSTFLVDPMATAVEASQGDSRFVVDEVAREMSQIRIDNASNRELGPPLCKTIDLQSHSKFCRKCPRWANTLANPKQSPLHTFPVAATPADPTIAKKLVAARYRLHAFYRMGGADVQKSRRLAAQVIREFKDSDPLIAKELAPSLLMLLARQGSSPAYIKSSAEFCGLTSDNATSLTNWTFSTLKKEEQSHD